MLSTLGRTVTDHSRQLQRRGIGRWPPATVCATGHFRPGGGEAGGVGGRDSFALIREGFMALPGLIWYGRSGGLRCLLRNIHLYRL